jgi:hypothetical protein
VRLTNAVELVETPIEETLTYYVSRKRTALPNE